MSSSREVLGYQELRVSFNQLKQPGLAYDLIKSLQAMEELTQTTRKFHECMLSPKHRKQTLKKVHTLNTCPLQQ